MSGISWRVVTLVSAVQILSESVFFAQGILQVNDETNATTSGQKEENWVRICVPVFYAATRQISEPCWKWIFRGYGDQMTTAIGIAAIAVSVMVASCQEMVIGTAAYVVMGGIGMGLVRLQIKLMKSGSGGEDYRPLWGAGVYGIGLSLWPLLACLFIRILGLRYTMLILAGTTLHAVPLAMFVRPPNNVPEEDKQQLPGDSGTPHATNSTLPCTDNLNQGGYRPSCPVTEWDSYKVRPFYYVEVLPGIPEESEHESDCDRDHEMQRVVPEVTDLSHVQAETRDRRKLDKKKIGRRKWTGSTSGTKSFTYTLFVATILLRLGDQLGITIVISMLPIFTGYLQPNLRLLEKAFLISLCGFSRILTELPLLALYVHAKKTKVVFLGGPLLATFGLCLTWNSESLDALTLASFGLGLGSGAASAALQVLTPSETSCVSDAADVIVGFTLLAIVPLMRILILRHAIHGVFLLGAGIYTAATITFILNFRKTT